MARRALCVGCNYPAKKNGLSGAVSDAFLIADCLQRSCGFEPEDICVLHDTFPGQAKSSGRLVDVAKRPTRANIMQRLRWLVQGAKVGDVLFFSFAGYGLQVDDVDGYQDDGLDEAILPTDFADGVNGHYSVILVTDIHDVLMGVPKGCCVTVVMDCDHATTVVDVTGTMDGKMVKGLQFSKMCGLPAHAGKMQLAQHDRSIWLDEPGAAVGARPRFQPMMQVANPRRGRLPSRPAMSKGSPAAFCFSAAAHGQTALELQVASIVDGREIVQQHGALSWSFVQALESMRCECTYGELFAEMESRMGQLRARHLPRMDQEVVMTFARPFSDPAKARILKPVQPPEPFGMVTPRARGRPTAQTFPAIVPPPPPGFLGGGLSVGSAGSFGSASRTTNLTRPYASFSQPEEMQSHYATAGLHLWRAAWQAQATDGPDSELVQAPREPHYQSGASLVARSRSSGEAHRDPSAVSVVCRSRSSGEAYHDTSHQSVAASTIMTRSPSEAPAGLQRAAPALWLTAAELGSSPCSFRVLTAEDAVPEIPWLAEAARGAGSSSRCTPITKRDDTSTCSTCSAEEVPAMRSPSSSELSSIAEDESPTGLEALWNMGLRSWATRMFEQAQQPIFDPIRRGRELHPRPTWRIAGAPSF